MDIDLLAKMVKEVGMDHDSVTLPGMGSFVAELVPASFADVFHAFVYNDFYVFLHLSYFLLKH